METFESSGTSGFVFLTSKFHIAFNSVLKMARRDLVEMYCAPEEYIPPVDKDFSGSTQFPNLNSEEYRRKFSLTPGTVHSVIILRDAGIEEI